MSTRAGILLRNSKIKIKKLGGGEEEERRLLFWASPVGIHANKAAVELISREPNKMRRVVKGRIEEANLLKKDCNLHAIRGSHGVELNRKRGGGKRFGSTAAVPAMCVERVE